MAARYFYLNYILNIKSFIISVVFWINKTERNILPHLNQSHELIDGVLLAREALLQLLGKTVWATVNRVDAPVPWRTQDHLVKGVFQWFPL